MRRPYTLFFLLICLLLFSLAACGTPNPTAQTEPVADNDSESSQESGTLSFVANGEDFVRQGFVTKDGWQVDFEHVYITLTDVTAYQTDPPYDAASGVAPEGKSIVAAGPITLDLAAGDENAEPLLVATAAAEAGQYNALGWRMVPAADDAEQADTAGATIALLGSAAKEGTTVNFVLKDGTTYAYNCGEYVGDGRKGIVDGGGVADLEATFHFDHLFGDADTPADDALNVGALGFDPLAALAEGGTLNATVAELATRLDAEPYSRLVDALAGLGHVGEGHCFEANGGYTGHNE